MMIRELSRRQENYHMYITLVFNTKPENHKTDHDDTQFIKRSDSVAIDELKSGLFLKLLR